MGFPWKETNRLSDAAAAIMQLMGQGYMLHVGPGEKAGLAWPRQYVFQGAPSHDVELPCTYEVACELIDFRAVRYLEINTRNYRLGRMELVLTEPGDYYSLVR